MSRLRRVAGALAVLGGLGATTAGAVAAQVPTSPGAITPEVNDPLRVFLVTMGPGEEVWNRFGHNAIWIHDASTGEDLVWNWGLFHFDQVGFWPRLVRGEMLYSMGGMTLDRTIAQYQAEGRDVWAQELALTPIQKADLDRLIRRNAQPANREYIYHYYLDNCSTRVRDALDAVLGGGIEQHFSGIATPTTWRWHTRRLVQMAPLVYGGIALVLGQRGDETISAYEEMFLPMRLRAHLAGFFVEQRDGSMRPLVLSETVLVDGAAEAPPEAPARKWPTYLVLGLVSAGVVVALGTLWSRGMPGRAVAALPIALWSLLAGVAAVTLLGAYFTDHTFWYRNENVLQATPLSLLVGVLVLAGVVRPKLVGLAARLALWAAALSVAGLALKVLPVFSQQNVEILALAVPLHLAIAVVLRRWASVRAGPASRA